MQLTHLQLAPSESRPASLQGRQQSVSPALTTICAMLARHHNTKGVRFDSNCRQYDSRDVKNMELDDFEDNVVVRLLSVGLNLATDSVVHR